MVARMPIAGVTRSLGRSACAEKMKKGIVEGKKYAGRKKNEEGGAERKLGIS